MENMEKCKCCGFNLWDDGNLLQTWACAKEIEDGTDTSYCEHLSTKIEGFGHGEGDLAAKRYYIAFHCNSQDEADTHCLRCKANNQ